MTDVELRLFLKEKGGLDADIDKIAAMLSAEAVKKLYFQYKKMVLPDQKAEEIAYTQRAKFVEHIQIDEAGGIVWNDIKNYLS